MLTNLLYLARFCCDKGAGGMKVIDLQTYRNQKDLVEVLEFLSPEEVDNLFLSVEDDERLTEYLVLLMYKHNIRRY